MKRSLSELLRIAGVGGGFTVDATEYQTGELVRIAGCAAQDAAPAAIDRRKPRLVSIGMVSGLPYDLSPTSRHSG